MDPIKEHFLKFLLVVVVGYAAGINAFLSFGTSQQQVEGTPSQFLELVLSFALATLLVFILLKYLKVLPLLLLIELISLSALSYLLFFFITLNEPLSLAISFAVLMVRLFVPSLRWITPMVMAAGGSAFFGVAIPINVLVAFAFLLVVYDFISVFITKHMVEMAMLADKAGLSMAISTKGVVRKGKVKRVAGLSMGLGDVVFPTAIAVSAFPLSPLLSAALLVAIPVGYILVLWVLSRLRVPIPALPPMLLPQFAVLAAYIALTFI